MKLIVSAILLTAVVMSTSCSSRPPQMASLKDGTQISLGSKLWPAPSPGTLKRRLEAAGLPNVKGQPETYHRHSHLQVFKDGRQVLVPADIGIGVDELSPVHTHEETGVIHVESPVDGPFTVGQFFILWDVSLDGAKLTVNGQEVPDPKGYQLKDGDLLTVHWGPIPQ